MTDPEDQDPLKQADQVTAPASSRGLLHPHWTWRFTRHGVKIFAEIVAGLVLIVGVASAYLAFQFSRGPIAFEFLNAPIAAGITAQLPPGFSASISAAEADRILNGLSLTVKDLVVRDDNNNVVLATPSATIGFDGSSLLLGQLLPRAIDLSGLVLSLTIKPDSSVSISTGESRTSDAPPVAPGTDDIPETIELVPSTVPQSPLSIAPFMEAITREVAVMGLLEHARLTNGVLRIDDQRRNRVQVYRDLNLDFDRLAPELMQMAMNARGETGIWSLSATLAENKNGKRRLTMAGKDVSVSEILGFASADSLPVRTEMPLSFTLFADIDERNMLAALSGSITGGNTVLKIEHYENMPIRFDRIGGEFKLDAAARVVRLSKLEFQSGNTNWVFSGSVKLPDQVTDGWAFDLRSNGAMQTGDVHRKTPIRIDTFAMQGTVMSGLYGARIERFDIKGPDVTLSGSVAMGHVDGRDGWAMTLAARDSDILSVLAFWPTFLSVDVRTYLAQSVEGGLVDQFSYRIDLDPESLRSAMNYGPIPDESMALDMTFRDGVMRIDPGLPKMKKLSGKVNVSGTQVALDIQSGSIALDQGGELPLSSVRFRVADTRIAPAMADIAFDFRGDVEPFFQVLNYDMMRSVSVPPVDANSAKGRIDMAVKIRMPLKADLQNDDIVFDASGQFKNLSVENIFGREKIENADAKIVVKPSGMQVSGEGKLSGAPLEFDLRQKRGAQTSELALTLTTDDAFRARRGLKTSGTVTGLLVSRANLVNVGSPTPSGKIEIDLQKAAISNLIPGWVRPAGRAGKLTFDIAMTERGDFEIDNLVIDDPSISMRAQAVLAADGSLVSMTIPDLRLAPTDRVSVNVERANFGYKLKLSGESFDGRGVLKSVLASNVTAGLDLDVDLKVARFSGFNAETARNLEYRGSLRGGIMKDLRLQMRLSNAVVMGQNARGENGQNVIVIESSDAGAFMRFADIYRRMNAGAMTLELGTSGEPLPGRLTVKNFAILDEAAIQQLTVQTNAKKPIVTDPRNVAFSRMQADFTIGNGRLLIRDATLSGPALGGTLEGTIDYSKNTLDMRGTFVPAFAVNNLFNNVPVIGTLLGGANEGIIGINYRVTGSTEAPQIAFNPLSVVTPGFLRRLFDFGGPVQQPATAPVPPSGIPTPPATLPQKIE